VEAWTTTTGVIKMTITVQPARNEFTANAGQTIFNYTFKIFSITDLNVYITPAGQDANDSTDLTTAFTVSGVGNPAGGSITLTTPTNLNDKVTIVSDVPSFRTTDYQNNGDFIPVTVNNDFDRVVSIVKKIEDSTNRSLLSPQSQQGPKPLFLPSPLAQSLMRWKSDLTGFENIAFSDLSPTAVPNDLITLNSTLAAVIADPNLEVDQVYILSDRANGIFDVVLTSGVTVTGGKVVQSTAVPTLSVVLRVEGKVIAAEFGVDFKTGTTIVSTLLQEAIDFANTIGVLSDSSAGAEVIVDPGQGLINVPLILYGGFGGQERVHLICAGSSSTTIKLADGSNCDMIRYNSTDGFNHCRIQGVLLDGNRANQTQFTLTITAISIAAVAVITYTGTDPANDDFIATAGVVGMIEINGKHGVIANLNTGAKTFEMKGINSSSYTAYVSGGTVTQKFRGIYALKAFSGSRFTDLKINDIAGVAIDCEQVSNGPLLENVGITRAGTHGLYIHASNNDGFNVINMEVGTAGEDGIGFPYHIYNVTPSGHGNFMFNNIRHDNGGAAQTPQAIRSVVFEEAEVSCLFLSPRFRWNSDVSATYTAFTLERNAKTFLMIHGYGLDSAPIAVTENLIDDIDNSQIHIATTSEPMVYHNLPMQMIETAVANAVLKMFVGGEAFPRAQLSAQGLILGGGTLAPDLGFRRNNPNEMALTDAAGGMENIRVQNLVMVAGNARFDELASSPAGIANKALLFSKDSGGGKTQLIVRFGTGAEQVIATEP